MLGDPAKWTEEQQPERQEGNRAPSGEAELSLRVSGVRSTCVPRPPVNHFHSCILFCLSRSSCVCWLRHGAEEASCLCRGARASAPARLSLIPAPSPQPHARVRRWVASLSSAQAVARAAAWWPCLGTGRPAQRPGHGLSLCLCHPCPVSSTRTCQRRCEWRPWSCVSRPVRNSPTTTRYRHECRRPAVLLAPPVGEQVPQSPQPAPESPAGSRVVPSLEAFAAGGGKMLVLSAGTDPMFTPS